MNIFTPQPQQQLNANDWTVVTLKRHWPDKGSHSKTRRRNKLGSTVSHRVTLQTEHQQRPVWRLPRSAIGKIAIYSSVVGLGDNEKKIHLTLTRSYRKSLVSSLVGGNTIDRVSSKTPDKKGRNPLIATIPRNIHCSASPRPRVNGCQLSVNQNNKLPKPSSHRRKTARGFTCFVDVINGEAQIRVHER